MVTRLLAETARETPEADRDLMQTLLAFGVSLDRAASLVSTETSRAANGALAEYADLIRKHRAARLPKGSEARRRLGMVADMLDPNTEDSWDYKIGKEENDGLV